MTLKIKIYLAAAAIIFLTALSYSLWSYIQIKRLEKAADNWKHTANEKQKHAGDLEQRSRVYEEKIAYLETQISELGTLARKQDEELKTIGSNTRNARADVERSRRIRSAAATADEVCRKLAELGHACQQ